VGVARRRDAPPPPPARRRPPRHRRVPGRRPRAAAVRRPGHLERRLLPRLLQGAAADRAAGLIHHRFPLPSPELSMLEAYRHHVAERAALGIPPLPLSAQQTAEVIELLKNPPAGEEQFLVDLLTNRVPAGVDDAAKVKASYLAALAFGSEKNPLISRERATELLGTMLGGYNVSPLIELLDDTVVGTIAAEGLKKTLLVFDQFHDVEEKAKAGNANAKAVLQSWADAEWFTSRPEVPESLTITVFKVPGETNTDDLSPAPDATTRPDIPMHALAMLKNKRPDAPFQPEEDGKRGPIGEILKLKEKGHLVAYVGDVVGTGSSRKSA